MKWRAYFSSFELLIFILLFLLNLFLLLFYFKGMEFSLIHKGIKSLQKKNYVQAQKHFDQVLAKKPFDPWSYLNIALSHDLLNAPDKALQTYDIVSSSKQSNLAPFFSYFNKGELNGRLGQLEKALENYQQALTFRYKEKEIKQNIELLFRSKKQNAQKENQSDSQQENENENQENSENKNTAKNQSDSSEDKKQSQNQDKKGANSSENEKSSLGQNKGAKESKELSDTEQKAILEEIEKQENRVRAKFYKGKKIFGDKTQKDW